jgi:hypothetical protein
MEGVSGENLTNQPLSRRRPPMTPRKLFAAAILLVILTLLVAGAAPAAILQKGSQIVNLVVPINNNGDVAFSDLYIRNSDGSATPYVLPPNTVLIITMIAWHFVPSQGTTGLLQLNLGEYYRAGAQVNNNRCGGSDSILPGVAATNMSSRIYLEQYGDPERTPVPGTLSMRLVCYTAPDN